jgi:molybdate transport system regulatory protein
MAKLKLRIDLSPERAIGPGKIRLLELIDRDGSISAAARALDMSYRRAWLLIDALHQTFREPVIHTAAGGRSGGGASLTPFGRELVERYRTMEAETYRTLAPHLAALEAAMAPEATQVPSPHRGEG